MAKSKNQKHWYTRWWAILIYVFVGLFLIQFLFLDSDTKFLEDQNYEVIDYGYNNLEELSDFAYVEMKGFGSREEQVEAGLIFLKDRYKTASEYIVRIFTENEECRYSIDGDIYRAYWSQFGDNPISLEKIDIEDKMDYIVWVGFLKNEIEKMKEVTYEEYEYPEEIFISAQTIYDEYLKLNNSQIDIRTISWIVSYNINKGYCE